MQSTLELKTAKLRVCEIEMSITEKASLASIVTEWNFPVQNASSGQTTTKHQSMAQKIMPKIACKITMANLPPAVFFTESRSWSLKTVLNKEPVIRRGLENTTCVPSVSLEEEFLFNDIMTLRGGNPFAATFRKTQKTATPIIVSPTIDEMLQGMGAKRAHISRISTKRFNIHTLSTSAKREVTEHFTSSAHAPCSSHKVASVIPSLLLYKHNPTFPLIVMCEKSAVHRVMETSTTVPPPQMHPTTPAPVTAPTHDDSDLSS